MAGHSKRHNIKHKKARTDAVKAKVYAKIAKVITVAARYGADPSMNPRLELALQKARYHSLPKHVVQKAIAKGSGTGTSGDLQEIYYEAYGPGGCALYIRALTDNTNRSAANIRTILTRAGCAMGELGSVSRQFAEKGVILINGIQETSTHKGKQVTHIHPLDIDQLTEQVLEWEIEDIEVGEGACVLTTTKNDFLIIQKKLQESNYHISEADLQFLATNLVTLSTQQEQKLTSLLEALDEDDDVDSVFHNAA